MAEGKGDVVQDIGRWEWNELWTKEDWWAVWLGFFILFLGVIFYFPSSGEMKTKLEAVNAKYGQTAMKTDKFKTVGYYKLSDAKKKVKAKDSGIGKFMSKLAKKPHKWSTNPLDAFYLSDEKAAAKAAKAKPKYEQAKAAENAALEAAMAAEDEAAGANFNSQTLNMQAKNAIDNWRNAKLKSGSAKKKASAKGYNQIGYLIALGIIYAVFFGIGMAFMGKSFGEFFKGFMFVFLITILVWVLANQASIKAIGINYAIWAIFIGMLISNTVGTPKWAIPAVQTEYFIKTGLVLLGAKILFEKIITIGTAGIFVAWVVTPTVWLVTYWFGQKIVKMPSK